VARFYGPRCICACGDCRVVSPRAVEPAENFQYHSLSRHSSASRETTDFSTSSLPRRVSAVSRSPYNDSSLPMLTSRNTKLSGGRLGSVSPYDVNCSPSLGWSQHPDNLSSLPENSLGPVAARVAPNLPMRHHLAHIPLNAIPDQFPSNDHFRYSYREHVAPPPQPSSFHRIVSLPTRHHRRHAAVPARSAQV